MSLVNDVANQQVEQLFGRIDGSHSAILQKLRGNPTATLLARFLYPDNVPELPEVEPVARGLDARVSGDKIDSVWIGSKTQPLKSPADVIALTLAGKRIVRVHRAGKHIVFDLEGEARTGKPARSRQTRRAASRQPSAPRRPD